MTSMLALAGRCCPRRKKTTYSLGFTAFCNGPYRDVTELSEQSCATLLQPNLLRSVARITASVPSQELRAFLESAERLDPAVGAPWLDQTRTSLTCHIFLCKPFFHGNYPAISLSHVIVSQGCWFSLNTYI